VLAQSGSYYHDPSLDTIASGVANSALTHDFFLPQIASNTASQKGGLTTTNWKTAATGELFTVYANLIDSNNNEAFSFGGGASGTGQFVASFETNFPYTYDISNALSIPFRSGENHDPLDKSIIQLGTFNGHSFNMDLRFITGNLLSPTFAASVRMVLASIIWFIFFMWGNSALQHHIEGTLSQRQIQGNNQSVFGWNLNVASALLVIGFISTFLYYVVARVAAYGVLEYFHAGSYSGIGEAGSHTVSVLPAFVSWLGSASSNIPAWDVLTSFCPIGEIATAYVTYLTFTRLTMWPIFVGVRSTILFFAA